MTNFCIHEENHLLYYIHPSARIIQIVEDQLQTHTALLSSSKGSPGQTEALTMARKAFSTARDATDFVSCLIVYVLILSR